MKPGFFSITRWLLLPVLLCPVIVLAQDSASDASIEAPLVIIFGDGRWHFVSMLEEKYGTFVYSKPGGRPVATTENQANRKRTLEVNSALRDLAAVCSGESRELSHLFSLEGRSKDIFNSASAQKLQACFQYALKRYRWEQSIQRQALQQNRLSEIADEISLDKAEAGPDAVISNRNVGAGDSSVTVGGQDLGGGYNHEAEYVIRSKGIIEEECGDDWPGDPKMYRYCVSNETNAVARLKARSVGLLPIDTFLEIRDDCREEWPRGYRMRDNCEVEEIGAYWSIERKKDDPDFSAQAIQGFKNICVGRWPRNYRMQKHCMEDLMEEFRPPP